MHVWSGRESIDPRHIFLLRHRFFSLLSKHKNVLDALNAFGFMFVRINPSTESIIESSECVEMIYRFLSN